MQMEKQLTIWKNVTLGVGGHGGFLTRFGETYVHADADNRIILEDASVHLIHKYHLNEEIYFNTK